MFRKWHAAYCAVSLSRVCNVMSIHYRGRCPGFLEENINFPSLFCRCNHTMNRYESRPCCGSICVWCNWTSLWVLTEQTGHRGAHYSMAQWGLCLPSATSPTRDKMGKANSSHFNTRFISHPAGYLCPYLSASLSCFPVPVCLSCSSVPVLLLLASLCFPNKGNDDPAGDEDHSMEETRSRQCMWLCRAAYGNKSTTGTRDGSNHHLGVERRALCAQGTFL